MHIVLCYLVKQRVANKLQKIEAGTLNHSHSLNNLKSLFLFLGGSGITKERPNRSDLLMVPVKRFEDVENEQPGLSG